MFIDDKLHREQDTPLQEQVFKLQKEVDELKKQVRTDYLTGLFNRRHLDYALDQEIERTYRTNNPTTLILMDIDNFKQFNDGYGHLVGDHALKYIANIIRQSIRKVDIACRFGGEEFAIILPSTPAEIGYHVAERIRVKIASNMLNYKGDNYRLTASLGVDSINHGDSESHLQLIERCDQLLYSAKDCGKNCVILRESLAIAD